MNFKKMALNKQKTQLIGSLLILAVFVLPFLSFAGSRKDMYVDLKAKGAEEGTASHPYHSMGKALRHANSRTDVHVAKGEYEENFTIPSGVRVFGENADDVVFRGDSSHKAVVTMKEGSEINKVTVKKGEEGILVKKGENSVSIIEVVVKENDGDGIKIESGAVKNSEKISITDSTIVDNGKSGIYSERRRLVLINNEITGNSKDGIDIAGGSSAWIEKNSIRNNKSGMKLTLDDSQIFTKNNTFRNNDHQGIEISSFGGEGRIDINKAKITNNEEYGIAKLQRGGSKAAWKGLTVQSNTDFASNKLGDVSSIINL